MLLQISLLIAGFNFLNVYTLNVELDVLTSNFFENLQGDPILQNTGNVLNNSLQNDLSDFSKQFIEKQIENYVTLATHKKGSSKKKRSLLDELTKDVKGTYLLSGIQPISATVPARFPADIALFQQNFQWYAACLESQNFKGDADNLVIYQYTNKTFIEKTRLPVTKGVKLATINLANSTLIAVAENDTLKSNFEEKSGIYEFTASELVKIQSINMNYARDIAMWKIHNEVYMSIAHYLSNKSGNIHYELEIPIYKWLGKHFDEVQTIEGKGVTRITPFKVDNINFLAIANSRDEQGKSKIYSEIYKYDYHLEKYVLHQRILTSACNDIKFFKISQNNRLKDNFLVVANMYDEDSGTINYETDSIIYKFVDDYFIPFQGFFLNAVEEWLPVEFQNQFVLFTSTRFDGLRSFQYDGWAFREIPQKTAEILQGSGIKCIRSANFNNTPTIVVANKQNSGNFPNLFKLEFTNSNSLNEIYDEMIVWCGNGLDKIEQLSNDIFFDNILGKAARADIDEGAGTETIDAQMAEIHFKIDSLNSKLAETSITADEIIFNNSTFIHNLDAGKINDFIADELLENVLDINQGFELDEINLESLKTEFLSPKMLNGRNATLLIHRSDDINVDSLTVRGNLIAHEGMQIRGQLNGVAMNKDLLQVVGDQDFSQPLVLATGKVDEMRAKSLNGENLANVQLWDGEPVFVSHLENLTVTDLTIGGYINDVDVSVLDKYALKQFGNQEISADYIFEAVEGENLEIDGEISSRKLSELIPIDEGTYSINQDMIFKNNLAVNDLKILNFLDGIKVEDMLLKNQEEEQEISGEKIFDDLIIYNAIHLQGNIKSDVLKRMNPMVTMDEEITLEGDYTITGNVQVEDSVIIEDIVTRNCTYSLTKLETDGVKLTDTEITPRLRFIQQLNVGEIFIDEINNRDPSSFVIIGGEEPQIIQGSKIIIGDLHIAGSTNAVKINDVNVEELENKVMKIEGDQTIIGEHHIKHLIVDNILSNSTRFGSNFWNDAAFEMNKTISGSVTIKSDLKTHNITIKGLINDFDFDQIVKDTVTRNTKLKVNGTKFFTKLTVDDLHVKNGVSEQVLDKTDELRINGPLLIKKINVKNIYFENLLNGVDRNSFGSYEVDDQGRRVVRDDQIFDQIVVYGNTYIASDKINDISITDLESNTVKIDEPFEFKSAIFETVISKNPILLEGQIENLDFDNLVLSNVDSEQHIFDRKIFKNGLTVINGSVTFGEYVNDINITEFCSFTMGEMETKNMTVEGNAMFVKGPKLHQINGIAVNDIWENAWFSDRDTTCTGYVEFDNIIFEDDLEVKGFIDNVSLTLLSENYFSKSKDQNIPATYSFQNYLTFEDDVSVPEITLSGEVNDINLDTFMRTVLLNNYDQVFEAALFLENCTIRNVTGNFAVNGMNLNLDVMRYDKINMVTGAKFFENLDVTFLKLEKNVKIQNVDVLDWFQNSVMKSTDSNITGTKTFKNAIFENGFYLSGTLNGYKFDENNIFLRNIPQEISGHKTIFSSVFDPIRFKGIKLKGLLNEIEVSDLINNQAYRNQDNTFKTTLNFYNDISTNNLIINKSYQGINVSELITNVTNLGALNNLLEEYSKLLMMSYKLENSIKGQAHFVHQYRTVQRIPLRHSMKLQLPNGTTSLGSLTLDGTDIQINLYSWDDQGLFINKGIIKQHGIKKLKYIDQVMMGRYLYLQDEAFGRYTDMKTGKSFEMPSNTTRSTSSFISPSTGDVCTLFVYFECAPKIYCENENGLKLVQELPTSIASKASSITVEDTVYLIIVNEEIDGLESHISSWRLNNDTNKFEIHQSLFEAQPRGIATAFYKDFYFLAIASGHLQNTMYSGKVQLRRFDQLSRQFLPFQSLDLDAPIQVEFSILPSNELVLYVLTDNPTEPLLVYRYEGIAGFRLIVKGSTLPNILYLNQFMGAGNQHLIVAQSYDEINIIQAIFKGERIN